MQHIIIGREEEEHDISDDSTACRCNPRVHVDKTSGEMFIIHNALVGRGLSEEDIKGILAFANDDPEYEGGNIFADDFDGE
jgi:hypothetical protein